MNNFPHICLRYFSRLLCFNHKHPAKLLSKCTTCHYLCPRCTRYSRQLQFAYSCKQCHHIYCLYHYNMHTHNAIHYIRRDTLTLYDPYSHHKTRIVINHEINSEADSISYGNTIYFMGGGFPTNEVLQIMLSNYSVAIKSNMLYKKCYHSLCLHSTYIYSVGGYDFDNSLGYCEKYNICTNTWSHLPQLITPRRCCASFAYKACLYAFCGLTIKININSMERMRMHLPSMWENVSVKNPPSYRRNVHAIGLPNYSVVIGGYNHKFLYDECYMLSFSNDICNCSLMKRLSAGSCFMCSPSIVNDNLCLFAVDEMRCIHIIDAHQLSMIEEYEPN